MPNPLESTPAGIPGAPYWSKPQLGRRLFFRHLASAVSGYLLLPGAALERVARAAPATRATARYCIFVNLQGAPSHTDTFDLKPASGFPSYFNPTPYNGVLFPQGLMPQLADQLDSIAFMRSVRAWGNVHGLMQAWVQIGRNPATPLSKISPHIGSIVSLELGAKDAILPAFMVLNGNPAAGAGFLPIAHGPFVLTAGAGLPNTSHPDGSSRFAARSALLRDIESGSAADLGAGPEAMADWKLRSQLLMYNSNVDRIFKLAPEDRARFGGSPFGDACLTARNLLRANLGARFIQISFGGWDHHSNLYPQLKTMAGQLDPGLASLVSDLKADGLLDQTLIVAQGEFGRTVGPLNRNAGRDHYQQQAVLFAGARIHGGRAIGVTDERGSRTVEFEWSRERDARPEDIEATIYSALGIDWTTVRRDPHFGRGYEYVPSADQDVYGPVDELWQ